MVSHSPSPDLILRAARRALRPLVRLWMRGGVTFPVVAAMLRELYVDVAQTDLLSDERSRTDSRIAVLTGVHRKELRRLRELPADSGPTPAKLTLGSLLVARWLAMAPFAEPPGTPRRLKRTGEASFEFLVESVTKDVRPRAVLDEFLAQGVVEVDAEDMIVLRDAAYLPQPGQEKQLFYFARNLHDHAAAACANIATEGPAPFLDRSVHYDGLSDAAAETLRAEARAAAIRLLVEINGRALQLLDASPEAGVGTQRVNLGVYLFAENEAAP